MQTSQAFTEYYTAASLKESQPSRSSFGIGVDIHEVGYVCIHAHNG